jgi:hypothetical protein
MLSHVTATSRKDCLEHPPPDDRPHSREHEEWSPEKHCNPRSAGFCSKSTTFNQKIPNLNLLLLRYLRQRQGGNAQKLGRSNFDEYVDICTPYRKADTEWDEITPPPLYPFHPQAPSTRPNPP